MKTDEEGRERLAQALRRVFFTRPVLRFRAKNARNYLRVHGRPPPRDDIGRFARDGAGIGAVLLADAGPAPRAPRPHAQVHRAFISDEEGGQRLVATVPKGGKSGVTVATGFDLGSNNAEDLRRLGLPPALVGKFAPYLGLQRAEAETMLRTKPLRISQGEADAIDALKRRDVYEKVRRQYDAAVAKTPGHGGTRFDDLDIHARTVIFSVAFQYGEALARETPKFWRHVAAQDWDGAIRELGRFGDVYWRRRHREAAHLIRAIQGDMMR